MWRIPAWEAAYAQKKRPREAAAGRRCRGAFRVQPWPYGEWHRWRDCIVAAAL